MLILLYKRTHVRLQANAVAGLFRVLKADSQQVKQVSCLHDYFVMLVTLVKYYKITVSNIFTKKQFRINMF